MNCPRLFIEYRYSLDLCRENLNGQVFYVSWIWSWILKLFQQFLPFVKFVTFSETLDSDDALNWQEHCLLQRIEAVRLSMSGTSVKITLRASPVSAAPPSGTISLASAASIDRIYISRADPAGHPYDSAADLMDVTSTMYSSDPDLPVVISFPIVLPPNKAVTLLAFKYNLDATQPLLIAVDFSATPESRIRCKQGVPIQEACAYIKFGAEAAKANRTGFAPYPGIYLIERIEIA